MFLVELPTFLLSISKHLSFLKLLDMWHFKCHSHDWQLPPLGYLLSYKSQVFWGWWNVSVNRGICCKAWQPKFDPKVYIVEGDWSQDLYCGKRLLTFTSCPLMSMCVLLCIHQINKISIGKIVSVFLKSLYLFCFSSEFYHDLKSVKILPI